MPSGKKSRQQRRAAPPPVRSQHSAPSRHTLWLGAGGAAVVVVIIVLVVALTGGSKKPFYATYAGLPGLQTGAPPWSRDMNTLAGRVPLLHLDALAQEALAFHIHQHLDVYVNGKHVTVPAGIGIDDNSFITELHTHAPDGVMHVESATNRPYTLGQFFGEWGVKLTASCIGRYCTGVHWWVNGKAQTGDPAHLVLKPHQEIVVAVGKAPANIPSSYKFPPGE